MSENNMTADIKKKVLVTESISAEGIELLRNHADVDINLDLSHNELLEIIGMPVDQDSIEERYEAACRITDDYLFSIHKLVDNDRRWVRYRKPADCHTYGK